MKTFLKLIIPCLLLLGFNHVNAQCVTFTKEQCKPKLDPYIYNGQLNSAVLNQGDYAELMLTFYSNQEYRIVVCAADELGPINFRLLDTEGNEIFANKDHEMIDHWDFTTNSTQQLVVEVNVPEKTDSKAAKSGCVSILVGFMDSKD